MASSEFMKIVMGYEDKGFSKGVARSMASIDQLNESNKELVKSFDSAEIAAKEFNRSLANNNRQIDGYRKAIVNSSVSVGKLGKGVKANAVPAMQEFSRVIQDAPYGIQGVANNIQQLTAQFQYLAAKSGGPVAALKGMVGALAGPAGLLLAVSAVTIAIPTLYKLFNQTARNAKMAKDEIDKLTSALDLMTSELDTLKLVLDFRKRIGLETDSQVAVQIAMTQAVISTAQGLLINLRAEQDITKQKKEQVSVIRQITAGYLAYWSRSADVGKSIISNAEEEKKWAEQEKGIKEKEKQIIKLTQTLQVLKGLVSETGNEFNNIGKSFDFGKMGMFIQAVPMMQAPMEAITKSVKGMGAQVTATFDEMIAARDRMLNSFDIAAAMMQYHAEVLRENLNRVLVESLADTLSDLGTVIGEALANGENVLMAAGNSLIASFGYFLSDLGRLLIEYGTLGVIKGKLDTAIAAGGPASIVAGAAAIAVGVALTAAGAAISSRANKGFSGGSSGSTAGVSGAGSTSFSGSTVSSASSVNTGGRYVFEIEGTKLVGVLSNTLARNRALGTDLNFG